MIFPERQELLDNWLNCLPEGRLVRFTDGTTTEGSVAEVYAPETEDGIPGYSLGKLVSVFQVETFAAPIGTSKGLPKGTIGREMYVCQ